MAKAAAGFRALIALALLALFIAVDHRTLGLAFGEGVFGVVRASIAWIAYAAIAFWLAGRAWDAIGPSARGFLVGLVESGVSALRLSLLSLAAAAIFGSIFYALRPAGEAQYVGLSWHILTDEATGLPLTTTYSDAVARCSESGRLPRLSDIQRLWAELAERQLKMSIWLSADHEGRRAFLRLMSNRYEIDEAPIGDGAPIRHMQVLCVSGAP